MEGLLTRNKAPQPMEAIAVRRAVIADADKVRYRVYSTPTEYIAVIAESALMAVKVAGVPRPHKIVRDMPTEGIAIEAKKMAKIENEAPRIALATQKQDAVQRLIAELPVIAKPTPETLFKPMSIADLQKRDASRARILPPELVNEIIEQHAKGHVAPSPVAAPSMPAPALPPEVPEAAAPPVPELTPEERLLQMADSMNLPTAAETGQKAEDTDTTLSPEEVDKLLNG